MLKARAEIRPGLKSVHLRTNSPDSTGFSALELARCCSKGGRACCDNETSRAANDLVSTAVSDPLQDFCSLEVSTLGVLAGEWEVWTSLTVELAFSNFAFSACCKTLPVAVTIQAQTRQKAN